MSENAAAVRRCPVCCLEPSDTKCECCGQLESHHIHNHQFKTTKDSDNCNICGRLCNDLTHEAHKFKPNEEVCGITSCCKPKCNPVHFHKLNLQNNQDERCKCGELHNHPAHFHRFRSKQGTEKCSKCDLEKDVTVHSDDGSCHSYKEKDTECKQCKKARENPIHQCHKFCPEKIINSHPISKKLLAKGCGDDASSNAHGPKVVWVVKDNSLISPLACKWKLLCNRCDHSTSDLEKYFEERDEQEYYYTAQALKMCEEDVQLFKMYAQRSLLVNIHIGHYHRECCKEYYDMLMEFMEEARQINLKLSHKYMQKFSAQFEISTSSDENDCHNKDNDETIVGDGSKKIKPCKSGMLFQIDLQDQQCPEFACVCDLDLTQIDNDLGSSVPLIYMRIPPYVCAFLLNKEQYRIAEDIQRHFPTIIHCVSSELNHVKDIFWNSHCEASKHQPTTKLIVGYQACCLRVKVEQHTTQALL